LTASVECAKLAWLLEFRSEISVELDKVSNINSSTDRGITLYARVLQLKNLVTIREKQAVCFYEQTARQTAVIGNYQ
jgi:hypothetical protein